MNCITRNSKLARTSKTPGRTQLLNFFCLGSEAMRLVDLPGYGYAKVNRNMKEDWQRHIGDYLAERASLRALVLVMDIRHPLTEFDKAMIQWSVDAELPLLALLTKCDKLKKGPAKSTFMHVSENLTALAPWLHVQTFSALRRQGLVEVHRWLTDQLRAPVQR